MVIVMGFAWAYVRFGNLPQVTWLLYGVKPVVIAIILQALWQLGRTAVKNRFLGALAIIGHYIEFFGNQYTGIALWNRGDLGNAARTYPRSRQKLEAPADHAFIGLLFSGGRLLRCGIILHRESRRSGCCRSFSSS